MPRITGIDHVQLAMPANGEAEARAFFADLLGFREIAKPAGLAGRGGCWFVSGGATLHLGVETAFAPARKAHPAFLVDDLAALATRLTASGVAVVHDAPLDGYQRIFVSDPFGNRIELMQKLDDIR